jgi:spermidine/putrescine transport system substrate-binding protein
MTGIAYNDKLTEPVTSVKQLLEDKSLKGQVGLLDGFGDTLGLVILANGDDPSQITNASFKAAIDRVKAASDSGQLRQFYGNDYSGPLAKGDLKACFAWGGDIPQLLPDNPNLKWVIPDDGGMIWTDNALIPNGGDVFTASTLLNFVYDPAVAAKLYGSIHYISPVKGSGEVLAKTDPKTASDELVFPTEETLSKVHLIDPDALKNQSYAEQWQSVVGA